MRRPNVIPIFSVAFILGMVCPTVLAQKAIPGSLFNLDAITQTRRDKTWENLGVLGGVLAPNEATPVLKSGTIRIPEIGFTRKTQWYTIEGRHQGFVSEPDKTPGLMLKDWTIELLARPRVRSGRTWLLPLNSPAFAWTMGLRGYGFCCTAVIAGNSTYGLRGRTKRGSGLERMP